MTPAILILLCPAAPAPLYRPPPPAPVVGCWLLTWGGSEAEATFDADGAYASGDWHGKWSWDARTRVLTVNEGLGGTIRLRWSAQLDRHLTGALVPVGPQGPSPVSLRKKESP